MAYSPSFLMPRAGTDRRVIGVTVTVLVHLLLIGAWQRTRSALPPQADAARMAIRWVSLPPLVPRATASARATRAPASVRAAPTRAVYRAAWRRAGRASACQRRRRRPRAAPAKSALHHRAAG